MYLVNSWRGAIVGLAMAGVALVAADAATGATTAPLTAASSSTTIEIRSGSSASSIYCYTPESVTVMVGDQVTWTDVSGVPHTVTRCTTTDCDGQDGGTGTDGSFTRADVDTGHDFTHVFTAPGTYTYFCEIHGYAEMHGTIVVRAPAATTTSTTVATTTTTAPTTATSSATRPNGVANIASVPVSTARSSRVNADSGARLAKTGSSARLVVLVGWMLVAVGALLASTRRRSRTGESNRDG